MNEVMNNERRKSHTYQTGSAAVRLSCHAGLDPASRHLPDEPGLRLGRASQTIQDVGPGFRQKPWIPAFAGMTTS